LGNNRTPTELLIWNEPEAASSSTRRLCDEPFSRRLDRARATAASRLSGRRPWIISANQSASRLIRSQTEKAGEMQHDTITDAILACAQKLQ